MNKLYNEKVFFSAIDHDEESKKNIRKIVDDIINNESLDLNTSYIPTLEEDPRSSFNVIEKLKKQRSLKLNLNISNNYFYDSKKEGEVVKNNQNFQGIPDCNNLKKKETNHENNNRPSRFTVFLSQIY